MMRKILMAAALSAAALVSTVGVGSAEAHSWTGGWSRSHPAAHAVYAHRHHHLNPFLRVFLHRHFW